MFEVPSGVLKKIVIFQGNFSWGWGSEGRKIVWASWDKVRESREAGGLGISNIKFFNLSLLSK